MTARLQGRVMAARKPLPKNLLEAAEMVGFEAWLLTGDGLSLRVSLVEYRPAFGNQRWRVAPVDAKPGKPESAVVDASRLTLVD